MSSLLLPVCRFSSIRRRLFVKVVTIAVRPTFALSIVVAKGQPRRVAFHADDRLERLYCLANHPPDLPGVVLCVYMGATDRGIDGLIGVASVLHCPIEIVHGVKRSRYVSPVERRLNRGSDIGSVLVPGGSRKLTWTNPIASPISGGLDEGTRFGKLLNDQTDREPELPSVTFAVRLSLPLSAPFR